jgi:hypothetical protein
MSTGYTEKQRMDIEQRFRETRHKVLRANIAYFVIFFASLYPLIATGWWLILAMWLVGGVALWWYNRTHWRCPACVTRWDLQQILASSTWDFCPDCGAPLTRTLREMIAATLTQDRLEMLKCEFRRRRRWRKVAIGVFIPLIIVILAIADFKGFGRDAVRMFGAAAGAVFFAIILNFSRCLNCKKGIAMGANWRCPRCGVSYR